MTEKRDELFGRRDAAESVRRTELLKRQQAIEALAGNEYFKRWLYDTLDDLSGFARDEGMLTDFGQGIRAAASRIKNRLLVVHDGVDLLADMARMSLEADHRGVVEAIKENTDK